MPTVSALLTGGVSVGILAGVVSGLFYLVVAGIRWAGLLASQLLQPPPQPCSACQKQGQRLLTCADCGSSRCEDCGHPQADCCCEALRELKLQSGEWFHKQLNRRFKTITAHQINYDYDHGSGMDPDSLQVREFIERLVETLLSGGLDDVCVSKLHSHPEYERMFECHHGPLCEALARLSFALQMAIANKPLPEKDSPSAAHSALKQLIQDIITEAMTLPKMLNLESQVRRKTSEDSNSSLDDINLKTYEDILATAILNKVIEKYQYSKIDNYNSEIDGNSNLLHTNRNSSDGKQINYISSVKFGVGNLDDSNNELLSDDKTWKMMTDPSLSLTIEEQIEEVTTYSNSEDENEKLTSDNEGNLCMPDLKLLQRRVPFPEFGMDIVEGSEHSDPEECSDANADTQPTDLVSPIDSWEENWLFQRKRLKSGGVTTQMPVPMLVPNPSEDFRALIGDRDAEDTSDLSECSEGALEDLVLADVDSHSVNDNDSFSVKEEDGDNINSKELVLNLESDKAADTEDLINSESSTDDQKNIIEQLIDLNISNGSNVPIVDIAETQNIELLKSSIAVDCLSEFGQKDSEYTEDYAVLPQRQMDSLINLHDGFEEAKPVPKPRTVGKLNEELASTEDQKETISENETEEKVEDSVCMNEFAVPPRPGITQSDDENCTLLTSTGTIAEREHKKWENAPPLPNNPYSPENISKRLNRKVHSTGSNEEVKETLKQAKGETIKTVPVEKPLQINCAPNELECRRYRRDYYINSKLPMDQKSPQSEFTRDLPEMKPVHQRYQHKVITEEEPCVAKIQISMKPKATKEIEDDLTKSKMVNNKESKPTELKEKNDQNETVDPELPAPHTVVNEIARWQNVINQTEQQWIKSVELAKNDVNDQDAVTVRAEKVKCNNNQLKKSDQNGFGKLNGNLEPHNNGIDLPSENGFVKKILKQVNSDGKMDLVHSKTNMFLPLENGKSASQDELKSEKVKITKMKFTEKTNHSDQALNSLKRESLSTTSEGVTDLPSENGFVKKILKQVNSDGKMDLVHSKTNVFLSLENGKSASQDEIKISKMKFTEKTNQSEQALNSLRCESLSTTSEGSLASSDSELANCLPSVKELAKHFLTVTDSDSSTSSPKCPSPTPKSRLPDSSGSVKKPAAASPNPQNNMTDAIRYPASSRTSLSPGQPVREIYPDSGYVYLQKKVHSLTARSISREFREGLKRNLPIQMDRNLYTQGGGGSDSSLSTTRSVEPRLDGDTTPGYTSDESGAVSPLLSEEIPRIRTLKSSIAFWEQMQQKNDG